MTPDEAVAIAGMRSVDLWKICRRNERGDYDETPEHIRERALDVLADAYDAALQRAETAERERDAAILREAHLRNMLDTERERVAKLREDTQRAERELHRTLISRDGFRRMALLREAEANELQDRLDALRQLAVCRSREAQEARAERDASRKAERRANAALADDQPTSKPEPPRIGWCAGGRYYVCQRCAATSRCGENKIVHSVECQRQSGEDKR